MKARRFSIALLVAAAAWGLGGCVVATVQPQPVYGAVYGPAVRMEPPPPRYEYQGRPPATGHVWIAGYWNWVGARYDWVPGRWVAPRPGYVWVPHAWQRDGEQWRQRGGRWEEERRDHRRRDRDDDDDDHRRKRDRDRFERDRDRWDRDGDGRDDRYQRR